jgi:hypothetical protein
MAALSITLRQGVCPRAQTRPTRLLHPDELTRPEYQLTRPTWLARIRWRQHDAKVTSAWTVDMPGMTLAWCNCDIIMYSSMTMMTSAWCNGDVNMYSRHAMSSVTSSTSQQTRQQSGTHLPHHQPRAEPRRAELEPSRAASRGTGSSVADPTCNRVWDWIWAVHHTRIVLIKS